jgi:uncharacterized membrane protein
MALTKTCTFAALHFTIAFTVVYLMTGSAFVGGTVALVEPACNTVAFFFHEKFWARYNSTQKQSSLAIAA